LPFGYDYFSGGADCRLGRMIRNQLVVRKINFKYYRILVKGRKRAHGIPPSGPNGRKIRVPGKPRTVLWKCLEGYYMETKDFIINTLRETPQDALVASHVLMLRAVWLES